MSTTQNELTQYLNNLLEIENFKDYAPNGLQIEGKSEIKKIAFAVSATIDSIDKAIEWKADALIVHHGLFWSFHGPKTITGPHGSRVKKLIQNDMNLLSYHLPLDAHLKYGNAVGIAKALEMKKITPFGDHKGSPTGVQGKLSQKMSALDLSLKLEEVLNHSIIHAGSDSSQEIESIGIITGGANNDWPLDLSSDLDAYITGEISEYNWHDATEAGIHFFAGGHHATERFGVMQLMDHLGPHFKCETHFFDSVNPA